MSALGLMRAMIRNACVNDGTAGSGHEHRSVESLQEYFGTAGEVFEPSPGRQSLVYRIRGRDPSAPSLVLAPHIDVVPAEPSGWSVNPFSAEIVEGFVYGRGAVDMLNVAAAMAVAARPYVTGKKEPVGDLVFCALADEESGGRYGARPLVEERWDLVGGDFMLSEVAYPGLPAGDHFRVPVSVGEKGAFWSTLVARGTPAHGSAPYGKDNAIMKLVAALSGIIETPEPADVGPEWLQFVSSLDLPSDVIQRLRDLDELDGVIDEIAVTHPSLASYIHAATHLTISPNVVHGGNKTNIVPDAAKGDLDVRAMPGMDRHFVDDHLRKAMGSASDEIEIVPVMDNPANTSPIANKLWDAIADSVEELEGHRDLVPTMMTVATDARFWRGRGTVAYGVGLFDRQMSFSDMLSLFHGHDERVSVESVERTTKLYELVLDDFLLS